MLFLYIKIAIHYQYMKSKQQVIEQYNVEWVNIEFISETGCSTCAMHGKNDCPFACENTLGFFIKH